MRTLNVSRNSQSNDKYTVYLSFIKSLVSFLFDGTEIVRGRNLLF